MNIKFYTAFHRHKKLEDLFHLSNSIDTHAVKHRCLTSIDSTRIISGFYCNPQGSCIGVLQLILVVTEEIVIQGKTKGNIG